MAGKANPVPSGIRLAAFDVDGVLTDGTGFAFPAIT